MAPEPVGPVGPRPVDPTAASFSENVGILLKEEVLHFASPRAPVPEKEVILGVPQDWSRTAGLHTPTDQRRRARYMEIVRIRPSSRWIPNTDVLRLTEELIKDVLGTLGDLWRRYQNGVCYGRY